MSRLVSKRKKKRKIDSRYLFAGMVIIAFVIIALSIGLSRRHRTQVAAQQTAEEKAEPATSIDVELLTPNEYSRPGLALKKVKGIVVHYTANPGSTAIQNRDYFEGLKDSHRTHASSHFIVGLEGEIIQCIPTKEESYASNQRNSDTISIECCHYAKDGKFDAKTYVSLVRLCAYLCHRFGLTQKDIIRHYDVTGKICPKYFVDHPKAWKKFREDVKEALDAGDWNLTVNS